MEFYKYQGTGNDFIIIDDRQLFFPSKDDALIQRLCDRKFGIGADGLILLRDHNELDFEMKYYNADGHESSMCGNGGRCIVAFAEQLGIITSDTRFLAIDGLHDAKIEGSLVALKMINVQDISSYNEDWLLNTGSPHYVQFVDNLKQLNIYKEGHTIRNKAAFVKEGINVNFIEIKDEILHIATYERGVEDETLSCGTGATAAALVYGHLNPSINMVNLVTKGGRLSVKFDHINEKEFANIWLTGPAELIFKGDISI